MMDKTTGPECPRCGCEDSDRTGSASSWAGPRSRFTCNHCGHRFTAADPEDAVVPEPAEDAIRPVIFHVIRCPYCQSMKTQVTSTRRPIRWHRCGACGKPFKSVEASAIR